MATDKNFKLSKSAKRVLSTITDKAARKAYKDAMINAEDQFERNKKRVGKEKQAVSE